MDKPIIVAHAAPLTHLLSFTKDVNQCKTTATINLKKVSYIRPDTAYGNPDVTFYYGKDHYITVYFDSTEARDRVYEWVVASYSHSMPQL